MPREQQGLSRRPLPDADKRAASLARQLALLFRAKRCIPLGHIETFLLVAADEGRSVNDYAQRANVSKSVMSRQILDRGRHAHARAWARLGDHASTRWSGARTRSC